ncbi:hypothetical protein BDV41DRAFT_200654 [Aspergillus transmontanensis]|uniref:Uncharacterized protein n=1 Tax=Aspergillus transmontanensis TaxID=1034304 RepID=A0A5N6W322_9EURO|nr:hypothetical protein BDV41DRAFT_200654 [Aspergillus transmontanensis]
MRLTVEVLEEIFGWAKGMYTNTCLKISPTVRLPQEGVYLHFPDHEHAVAAIGEQVPPTIFNILPLYAPSGTGCSEFYVFRFRVPPNWPRPNKKWVQWDITNNTVRLTSYLRKSCIVKLHSLLEGGPNTFRVFIEDSELAIRVQQNRRVYSTRVLFVTRGMPRMSWPYFNHFTLEARSPN